MYALWLQAVRLIEKRFARRDDPIRDLHLCAQTISSEGQYRETTAVLAVLSPIATSPTCRGKKSTPTELPIDPGADSPTIDPLGSRQARLPAG
jgi:hypothetical protein